MSEVWLVSVFGLKGLEETFAFTKHSVYVLISYDFYLSNYVLMLCHKLRAGINNNNNNNNNNSNKFCNSDGCVVVCNAL